MFGPHEPPAPISGDNVALAVALLLSTPVGLILGALATLAAAINNKSAFARWAAGFACILGVGMPLILHVSSGGRFHYWVYLFAAVPLIPGLIAVALMPIHWPSDSPSRSASPAEIESEAVTQPRRQKGSGVEWRSNQAESVAEAVRERPTGFARVEVHSGGPGILAGAFDRGSRGQGRTWLVARIMVAVVVLAGSACAVTVVVLVGIVFFVTGF